MKVSQVPQLPMARALGELPADRSYANLKSTSIMAIPVAAEHTVGVISALLREEMLELRVGRRNLLTRGIAVVGEEETPAVG